MSGVAGGGEGRSGVAAEPVIVERDGHLAHLVLNRPAKLNALDGRCLEPPGNAVATLESDDGVRAIIVRGSGRAFCAGADLIYVRSCLGSAESYAAFLESWHAAFGMLEQCSKPTVAAVHGVALAGGLELTQVCDVVVAATDAQFGDQHAKFGLFPGGGSTQRLPRLIGQRRAKWLLMTGDRFSAAEGAAFGMVNRVVAAADLIDEAASMAGRLARGSMSANRLIKRSVMEGAEVDLTAALALERALAVEHMLGVDARIGLAAFDARREPIFSGADGYQEEGLSDAIH